MAGSTRAELASSGLDGSSFTSSYSSGQRGAYSGSAALDRSGSFREGLENRMMVPGPMASRNAAPSAGMPPINQYLGLETFSTAELKNVRSGELRRVLGVSVEDHSFGSLQSKSLPPISWEELKRYRGAVEETSSRARDRSKLFQDSVQKLDKYRNIVSKKRQRNDIQLSDKIGSSNMLKMGSQMHQTSSELAGQKLDERPKNGLPNKRVRSSIAEVRASSPYSLQSEGRNTLPVRQGAMVDKDKSIIIDKDKTMLRACNGVPVATDEKMRGLPTGGDGWEKKMKRKRSVGTMVNKSADGDRELKQAMQQRPNNESRPRSSDGLGFRTGSSNGIYGSNKMDGTSQLSGGNSRIIPRNDLGNGSLSTDRREYSSGLDKERATAKGSNKLNISDDAQLGTQSPSTKRKASRAPRTGSSVVMTATGIPRSSGGIDGWEQPSGLNKVQPLTGAVSHKRTLPTGSSSPPVTKWGGQRPQKISRTRRANVVSPVSNFDEAQAVSEGFVAPDVGTRLSSMESSGVLINRGVVNNTHLKVKLENVQSPAGLSETEESAALENKSKEKGTDDCEIEDGTHTSTHKSTSFVLPMKKNKAPLREEIGDGVRRQGRSGRGSIQSRACLQLSKEKSENVENTKPLKSGRLMSDKTENKIGRPPKKGSDRRVSRSMQIISPSELTGESDDDREELLATAKAVRDGCNLSDFWKTLEPFFSPISSDDVDLVKHQIGFAEELDGSFASMLGTDCYTMGQDKYNTAPSHFSQQVCENNVAELNNSAGAMCSADESQSVMTTTGKMEMKRLFERSIPLSQRLLSALIVEEGTDMFEGNTEQGDAFLQFSSGCSPYGANGSVENEHGYDVAKYGIELDNDLGSQTNCHADNTPCNGFASPSAFRSPSTFISADIMREDDDNPDSTTLSELEQAKSSQQESIATNFAGASYKCQYEQMSLDDKILMELNSIGIYPEPALSEGDNDDEINKAVSELKIRLYEQVRKKKNILSKLEKAIQEKQEHEKRNREQLAMDKLVERAYFKLLGGRGYGSSHRSGSKVSKQLAMAFAKRTLARYRKFEETGQSCFSDPILRDVLFTEPIKEGEPKRSDAISSGAVQNMYIEPHHCQPDLRASASGVPSNMTERHGPGHNINECELDLYQGIVDPISNRGKKREVLLDDVAGAASRATLAANSILPGGPKWKKTDKDHNGDILAKSSTPKGGRSLLSAGRGERKSKVKPTKQKIAQLSTSGNGLGRVTETTNFVLRDSGETVNTGSTKVSQEAELASLRSNGQDLSKEMEDSVFTNLPLQGIDSIDELDVADGLGGQGQDIGSWLNVDEDALLDNDLVGLEIPMDDLSDLKLHF